MKNQNGSYDVQRDATFLAESGMLPKVSSALVPHMKQRVNIAAFCNKMTSACVTC